MEPGNYKSKIMESMVERIKRIDSAEENSRFATMLNTMKGPFDRSQYKEPDDVAEAALHFMTSNTPKRRYMVVPNQYEAKITIMQILREMVQLNHEQAFSYTREELIAMLDEVLGEQ